MTRRTGWAWNHEELSKFLLDYTTDSTYDERGNELSRTLPLGVGGPAGSFTETFQYDDLGRQTLHVSFEGNA